MKMKLPIWTGKGVYLITGLAVFLFFVQLPESYFRKINNYEFAVFEKLQVKEIKTNFNKELNDFLFKEKSLFEMYDFSDQNLLNSKIDFLIKNNKKMDYEPFQSKKMDEDFIRVFYCVDEDLKLYFIEKNNSQVLNSLFFIKITDYVFFDYSLVGKIFDTNSLYCRVFQLYMDDQNTVRLGGSDLKLYDNSCDSQSFAGNKIDKTNLDLIKLRVDKINSDFNIDVERWKGRILLNNRKAARELIRYAENGWVSHEVRQQIIDVFSVEENIDTIDAYMCDLIDFMEVNGLSGDAKKVKKIYESVYKVDQKTSSLILYGNKISVNDILYNNKKIETFVYTKNENYVPSLLMELLDDYYSIEYATIKKKNVSYEYFFDEKLKNVRFSYLKHFLADKVDDVDLFRKIVSDEKKRDINAYVSRILLLLSVSFVVFCFYKKRYSLVLSIGVLFLYFVVNLFLSIWFSINVWCFKGLLCIFLTLFAILIEKAFFINYFNEVFKKGEL